MVILNIFVGERSVESPPHPAATDLSRQVEHVFTVLKFIFSTKRNSFSVTDFLISNLLLHAYRLVRQSESCTGIIKNDREFWLKLKFCLHISVGIYNDIFSFVNCLWNVLLEVLTQSLSYWLYLLLLYLDFGPQDPMGLI